VSGLSDVAQITISLLAAKTSKEAFDIPLILGCSQRFPELARKYSASADMLTDGFQATDPEYLAMLKFEAQENHPSKVVVGRRTHLPTMKKRIVPTVISGKKYVLEVGGTEISFTSDGTATLAEVLAGLKAAVDALALPVTTDTSSGTQLDVTANTAGAWFQLKNKTLDALLITDVSTDGGVGADLDALVAAAGGDDWYALTMTHHSRAEVLAAAAWVESRDKVFLAATEDDDTHQAGSGDVMSAIKTSAYARTFPVFHENNAAFLGAALAGAALADDPGSNTYAFKQLNGVEASLITGSQVNVLQGKNGSYYVTLAGAAMTQGGKVGSGEWLDAVIGRDALKTEIATGLVNLQLNNKKIPMTDAGINQVGNVILAALKTFQGTNGQPGFIATDPAPKVTLPRAKDVSPTDRTNRTLSGVTFEATVQGAVHLTKIKGTITA
jgi:hypothetical protein